MPASTDGRGQRHADSFVDRPAAVALRPAAIANTNQNVLQRSGSSANAAAMRTAVPTQSANRATFVPNAVRQANSGGGKENLVIDHYVDA